MARGYARSRRRKFQQVREGSPVPGGGLVRTLRPEPRQQAAATAGERPLP